MILLTTSRRGHQIINTT
jgi:hypothetical protein